MTSNELRENEGFIKLPLVAILRGIKPTEVLAITEVLFANGFRFIEVPLNSPDALISIKKLVEHYGDTAVIGAGTVTDTDKLMRVLETGAKLIVTPNMNPDVIRIASQKGCTVMSGVQTPSEAFCAIQNGVTALKMFPAEVIGTAGLKAVKSVLPPEMICLPVGGIQPDKEQMKEYIKAGAEGFGLGSGLYFPGITLEDLNQRCIEYKNAWKNSKI